MAPKKVTGKRTAEGVQNVERERRTKRRQEEETASVQAPTVPSHVPSMSLRPVTSGRLVNFNFLRDIGMRIGDLIEEQGWVKFCSLNEKTYPSLVRTFYENVRLGANHVESTVKGKRVVVNEDILQTSLDLPIDGEKFLLIKDRAKTLRTVLGKENVDGISTVLANSLSLEMRLLHNFICRIFLQRTGRFDWVSEKDLSLMEHILDKSPVNLPYIIIMQMKETLKKARACLPYGMVLTLLFKSHGVSLEGEDGQELHHTDIYSSKTFERMGYHLVEGVWRKKGSNKRAIGESSSEEEDDNQPSPAAAASTPFPEPEDHPTADEETRTESHMHDLPTEDDTVVLTTTTAAASSDHQTSLISSSLLQDQMKALSDTLTCTVSSLFQDLKHSVDSRLDRMENTISCLKEKVEALESSRPHSQTDLQPVLDCISTVSESVKSSVESSVNVYREEVRALKGQVSTILDSIKMENDYTKGVGIIRSELGRLRGSAEAFANVQAGELIAMQKESNEMKAVVNKLPNCFKELEKQVTSVWVELLSLKSTVNALEISARTRPIFDATPLGSRGPSSAHPRAPPPHSSVRPPSHRSWHGANMSDSD